MLDRAAPPALRLLAPALAALLLAACGGGADPAPPATCDLQPSVTVGTGEAYRLIGPEDWPAACGTLTVRAPSLGATERLGVVLVNAGGADNATPTITASGTAAFAAAEGGPVAALAAAPSGELRAEATPRAMLAAGNALVVERRRAATAAWLAEGAPRPAPLARVAATAAAIPAEGDPWKDPRGPCVYSFATNTVTRQPATVQHLTVDGTGKTVAIFYATAAAAAGIDRVKLARPDFWASLDSYFLGTPLAVRNPAGAKRVLPALHEAFGQESDVDGNGALIFLFADLGRTGSGGFTVGYFDGTDAARPADTSAGCNDPSSRGSNGADMLYLLDPCTLYKNGFATPAATCPTSGDGTGSFPYSVGVDELVPAVMAHELQHDVIFNTRCLAGALASCGAIDDAAGDLWLNEGLSMVAEDFAGFGLHTQHERDTAGVYLDCARTSSLLCYQDVSLTTWPSTEPGNATGHYGGAHTFLRWHADQADAGRAAAANGAALTRALVASPSLSRAALASASGLSFEEGFARFGVGALFSGEDALFATSPAPLTPAPDFAFAPGVPWSPLHTTVGRVKYSKLQPGAALLTTLRNDGWGAYVSGRGSGAEATLTVGSGAAVKPRVAVVRFKGDLPLP